MLFWADNSVLVTGGSSGAHALGGTNCTGPRRDGAQQRIFRLLARVDKAWAVKVGAGWELGGQRTSGTSSLLLLAFHSFVQDPGMASLVLWPVSPERWGPLGAVFELSDDPSAVLQVL